MKKFKQKTRKAAKKRFSVSKKGKVTRNKAGKRHLNGNLSGGKVRELGVETGISKSDVAKVAQALPGLKIKE